MVHFDMVRDMTNCCKKPSKPLSSFPQAQDQIARAMLELAVQDGEPEPIQSGHLAAVLEGLAQAKKG
jgi:hypothetical protein